MAYITRYRHLPVISLRSSSFEISAIVDATRCAYCCQLSLCRLRTPVASVGTVHVSSHHHTLRQATPLITNNIKTPALIRILYTPNRGAAAETTIRFLRRISGTVTINSVDNFAVITSLWRSITPKRHFIEATLPFCTCRSARGFSLHSSAPGKFTVAIFGRAQGGIEAEAKVEDGRSQPQRSRERGQTYLGISQ
ncbi:hypothetical protein HN011_002057, partial [Eciton burchellii]